MGMLEIELAAQLKEVKAERDALAALCADAAAVLERTANDTLDGRNMAIRLREAPTTSLARLKAQWQAEALEQHADYLLDHGQGVARLWAQEHATELRRQAEEK